MGEIHWFEIINAIGVVAGLLFTGFSLRSETKTRKIANLLAITRNHRELWQELYDHPELARVLDPNAPMGKQPITRNEEAFVNTVILHINSVYHALKDDLMIKQEGLRRDVCWFFSLPIPRTVWEKTKPLQNDEFVVFVERCRNWK